MTRTVDTTKLHPVFVRQLDALAGGDIDVLMQNYEPDAALVRYEGVSEGFDEVKETLTAYLTLKPTMVELLDYAETGDTVFYRANMTIAGAPEKAFGTLVLRGDRIWRQTAGFGG